MATNLVDQVMGAGMATKAKEPEAPEAEMTKRVTPPAESFDRLLEDKIANDPAGIVEAVEPWAPIDPIPGLGDLSFGIAKAYKVQWQMIATLRKCKTLGFQPMLVWTPVGLHVVRGFTRAEWGTVQQDLARENEERFKSHQESKSNANWAQMDVMMRTEEAIAVKACMVPEYNRQNIRHQPAGVATALAKAASQASMLEEEEIPPPIRLS